MRKQERGIGNMPFIAVLVLMVIAGALFFMAQDRADSAEKKNSRLRVQFAEAGQKLVQARNAYNELVKMFGMDANADAIMVKADDKYPKPVEISTAVRAWLHKWATDIAKRSEATVKTRQQTVDGNNVVKVVKGEPTKIILYGTTSAPETITVASLLRDMPEQFAFAAKHIEEAINRFEQEYDANQNARTQHATKLTQIKGNFDTRVSSIQKNADSLRTERDQLLEQNKMQSATIDQEKANARNTVEAVKKENRAVSQDNRALKNRIITMKQNIEVALAEDPKDGNVIVADPRKGICYIDLGLRNKLSRDTRFVVWQAGKGNVRENIAEILVIRVDRTKAECRILKQNSRRPVTRGMNISNPFYNPHGTLKAYVFGDLTKYPTSVAKKRLAAAGIQVVHTLDDTVDIIILGEPAVGSGADTEDEAEAALAARQAEMNRSKRLNEIIERARTVGAVVVNERVLSTFISY